MKRVCVGRLKRNERYARPVFVSISLSLSLCVQILVMTANEIGEAGARERSCMLWCEG